MGMLPAETSRGRLQYPLEMLMSLFASAMLQGAETAHGDPTLSARSPGVQLSEEAREALARFRAPEGFRLELFAAEPLLANPVAFCFDALGRAYVAETFRHSKGVTDIRSHMDWLEDDLAIRSVADRIAMFRRHEGDEGLASGYAVETDRVRRVVDTDGDGVADAATVFADGFTDPAAGIGAGVIALPLGDSGAEVWFTCIPDVWVLTDEDGDGVAERRASQSTGYGLRVALLGHDLHGLVIGPDGRMYFSIGDRGFNVTTAEGAHLVRYGTGAVFRCELDGSELEIFCDGLRNPQELVFDDDGNLFTLDNNSDGGDQARWTWLLEGSDTGWRQAYQWVREPVSRGPWNDELLWKPYSSEQPAYILPPIANFTSGPSGLTLYPGTGWGESWRNTFFVCDFRGNPSYSGIYAFENERKGAGFELVRSREFVWNALPTDVDFGPDGDMYWTDWVTGWNQTGQGRMVRVTPETLPDGEGAARSEVAAWLAAGAAGRSAEELVGAFAHRDRRVRQAAQLELAKRFLASDERGLSALFQAITRAWEGSSAPTRTRLHVVGLGWHVARRSNELRDTLCAMVRTGLRDSDPAVVALAAQALGDLEWRPALRDVEGLCEHEDARVRLRAIEALGALGNGPDHTPQVVALLNVEGASDPWIRQACIRTLERFEDPEALYARFETEPAATRRALAVVLRRWKDAKIAQLLSDEDPLVRDEAARAIYDVPISAALPALAQRLDLEDSTDGPALRWRRSLHAARALGTEEEAARVASFAASDRGPVAVRAEALDVLARWRQAETRDGIVMDHRPLAAGELGPLGAVATTGQVLSVELLERRTGEARNSKAGQRYLRRLLELHASGTLGSAVPAGLPAALASIALAQGTAEPLEPALRRRAFEILLERDPDGAAAAQVHAAVESNLESPLAAMSLAARDDASAASSLARLAASEEATVRAEAIRMLGTLDGEASGAAFLEVGTNLAPTAPELVEWLAAAAAHPSEAVRALHGRVETAWDALGDPLARWRMCLEGGDAERGRRLFETKSETECMKCHVIGGQGGSEAGPDLDGLATRLGPEERLRAVVLPNDSIAEGFQSWIFRTTDGELYSGRVIEESAELVVLETNQKEQFEFDPAEIEVRKRDVSAMPGDISKHLSRSEMRDLLAFLATLE